MSTIPRKYKVIFSDNEEFVVTSFDSYDAILSAVVKYGYKHPGEDIPEAKEIIAINNNIASVTDIIDKMFNNKDNKP